MKTKFPGGNNSLRHSHLYKSEISKPNSSQKRLCKVAVSHAKVPDKIKFDIRINASMFLIHDCINRCKRSQKEIT